MNLLPLHTLMSISSTSHPAFSHHYILHDSLLTIALGTTLPNMRCPEGAPPPPDGWSYFVLVPIDNSTVCEYWLSRCLDILIDATTEALQTSNQKIEVWQGDIPLRRGFVPILIEVPYSMTPHPDDVSLIQSADMAARGWQQRYDANGEVPKPLRLFLERLE